MKKLILLFLLLPFLSLAQVSTGQEQEFDYGIKNNSTQTVVTPSYLVTQGIDGTYGKALVSSVVVPSTTAGTFTRVNFTGDQTVLGAGTFYNTNTVNKGTVASVAQSVINNDNEKKYFTQDFISILQPSLILYPPGTYAGQFAVQVTDNLANQKYTIEIYKTNSTGTPIASGVSGAPVGALGVTVITILDSGLLSLQANTLTNITLSGQLISQLTVNANERIRYHISAEKVGTAGANNTMTIFFGNSYNSYYDVPVPVTTDGVANKSAITGVTSTDALNSLNTLKANSSSPTFTGTPTAPTATVNTTGNQIATLDFAANVRQPEASRLSIASTNIIGWGDSLTAGAGGGGTTYLSTLNFLTKFNVTNNGVGGETSTQIKDRFLANTADFDKTVIIWAGRNNYTDPITVKADIATMVANLTHTRYLVISVLNGNGEGIGTSNYNTIIQLNNDLKAIYGKKYLDLRAYLVSLHNSTAQDLLDYANDIPPTSLRSDGIHLNTQGYTNVGEFLNKNLGVLFEKEGYLQSKDFKYYFENYSPLHSISDESFTGVKTATNTGTTQVNGINLVNNGTTSTARSLSITNNGTGYGAYINNASTGYAIGGNNASSGRFLYFANSSTGFGSYITNSSTGIGQYLNNTGAGHGIRADNTSSGYGFYSNNTGVGAGAYFLNSSTGIANIFNSATASTGDLLQFQKNGVVKSYVNNLGEIHAQTPTAGTNTTQVATTAFVQSATRPYKDGTYALISQTITNGVVENSPSEDAVFDALALKQNIITNPITGTGTATFIPKFTSSSSLGNSILYDTGTQIGLGTSNPMQTLHVASTINNGYLKITTSITGSSLSDGSDLGVDSSGDLNISNLENTNLNFYTNNLLRSRITNAGRHLIGTTTDNLKDILQVNGTISYLGLSFTSVTTGSPDIIFSTIPLGTQKTIGTINVDAGFGVADAILESYAYTTSGYGMQRITYTTGALSNRVFVRSLSLGVWTSWTEITSAGIKRYKAITSQAGTSAPTAVVLENSLGGTVVWGYSSVGNYTATLSGAFTNNKTFVNVSTGGSAGNSFIRGSASSTSVVSVNTATTLGYSDGMMAPAFITIEVYP